VERPDRRSIHQQNGSRQAARSFRATLSQSPLVDTPGCTTHACGVRDHGSDYKVAGESIDGKKHSGVQRATFPIDRDGKIAKVIPKASPKTHDDDVLEALAELASD